MPALVSGNVHQILIPNPSITTREQNRPKLEAIPNLKEKQYTVGAKRYSTDRGMEVTHKVLSNTFLKSRHFEKNEPLPERETKL